MNLLNDDAKQNRFPYLKIMFVYISKKSYVCTKICRIKLIQHVISIGSIKNLDSGSYFCTNYFNNFIALKLIQHVISIGSTKVGSPDVSWDGVLHALG